MSNPKNFSENTRLAAELLTLLLLLFFIPLEAGDYQELVERLCDAVHLPLFIIFVFVLDFLLHRKLPFIIRSAVVAAVGIFLAGCIELLQPYFDRSQSLADFQNGLLGIAFGVLFLTLSSRNTSSLLWTLAGTALVFVSAQLLQPAWSVWRGMEWQKEHFPILADFEESHELALWKAIHSTPADKPAVRAEPAEQFKRTDELQASGRTSLIVQTVDRPYSGVELETLFTDWAGYSELSFAVFSPAEHLAFNIRIDDHGDCSEMDKRFNRSFFLNSGWNKIAVSISDIENGPTLRKLDLHRIRRILFFTGPKDDLPYFYLDSIELHGPAHDSGHQ